MIPAVIYARFSSHAQNEQSIDVVCNEFAERQGYIIVGKYIDRAISGKTDNRPGFLRMVTDSENRQFEIVLVYQLDRFSRDRCDSAVYKRALKRYAGAWA